MEPHAVFKVPANVEGARNDVGMEGFKNRLNKVSDHVAKLEQRVLEIENFYSNNQKRQLKQSRNMSSRVMSSQNQREAASERMQDLISQFSTIFNKDLHLHDSSEAAIGKPRDFNSIRKRMEAKDGSGYKHVRDIYYDVRSILKDSVKYNDAKSNAHVTAKTLLAKFEQKWLLLFPQITQEEERIVKEEGLKQVSHAQLAKDISNELSKADMCLNEIRKVVLQRCRKISMLEKIELGRALSKLSTDDLMKALEIVAEGNPSFQVTGEELELDLTAQSESTLWRLKYFVGNLLKAQTQVNKTVNGGDKNAENKFNTPANPSRPYKSNLKRKKENPRGSVKPPTQKCKRVGPTV